MEATRAWLRGVLGPYANRDRVFRDADTVLVNHNGLAPKTDTYTHEDGRTVVLLCLHGTIPIKFRNVTYNIPIAIWVPYSYPSQPPICFVSPTTSMLVRASKHVDLSGKIYHPYLAYWHMNSEESHMLNFVRILQEIFAMEPPVYTKPSGATQLPSQQQQLQPQGAIGGQIMSPPGPLQTGPQQQAPLSQSQQLAPTNFPPAQRPSSHAQSNSPSNGFYHGSAQPLAMPDPRRHASTSPNPGGQPPPLPPPPTYANRSDSPAQQSNPQQHYNQVQSLPHHLPQPQRSQSTPPPPIPGKILAGQPQQAIYHQTPQQIAYQAALDERSARLKTGREIVRDKLRTKQREINSTLPVEVERLLSVNKSLREGESRVGNIVTQLREEEDKVRKAILLLQEKNEQLQSQVELIQQQADVNVDEVVLGSAVVYNQLFDVVADDHAIDDTLYYLGKALDAERVEPAIYLKHVRNLAREQFLKRALVKKIRQQVGLVNAV
ncbi:UEV domain-containing protein [Phlyctochytrium arcticum]|nr:UEV domain-containing protein [Phlyctochytrium arcticum]